jgi:CheY-like chemotaxis protein
MSMRVLHVDDEPDIREVVEMSLALDPNLTVQSCSSGSDALDRVGHWTPDLILLDVMMPVMDGPTTLARLRETPQAAAIPVVFMTARAQTRELDHFRSLGAAGVIPKPFDPMTLAGSVRNYLKTTRLDGLRTNFVERAKTDAAALLAQRALLGGQHENEALQVIRRIAHGLAGASGIYGLDAIGAAALAVENAAARQLAGERNTAELQAGLDRLHARILEH